MNIKVLTLIIFSSVMGIVNAADELTDSPNSSHKANSVRSENRPELLGDLTAKIMPIIEGLVEENNTLKKQLWKDHYFLWQTPVFPSRNLFEGCSSTGYQSFQGTEVDFVHNIFAQLKKQLLAIITDLIQENYALRNKALEYSQQSQSMKNQFASQQEELWIRRHALSENLSSDPNIQAFYSLINIGSEFFNNNDFLTEFQSGTIQELQKGLMLAINSMSWEEVHNYLDEILKNFNNDTLFVYGNNQPMTVGALKQKAQTYCNEISLQSFSQSREQQDLSKKFLQLGPKIIALAAILNDNHQLYVDMLDFLNKGPQFLMGEVVKFFESANQ